MIGAGGGRTRMRRMISDWSGSGAVGRGPREGLVVVALLVLLVGINIATADLYPLVWIDEVLLVEPAVNLATGSGLHSSAYSGQPRSEVWLSYMPLYPLVLSGWLRLFGVSLLSVRSFGIVLAAVSIGAVWLAARRHGILEARGSRIALVALAGCGAGISFSYRCGRGDTVTFALLAFSFLAVSDRSPLRRRLALLALGALVPISGLQGMAYVALLGALLFLFVGRKVLEPVVILVAGSALGLAALFLVLRAMGLWGIFSRVILAGRGLGGNLLVNALDRLSAFPKVAIEDHSAILLALLCLAGLFSLREGSRSRILSAQAFGALCAVWIPTLMCAAGRYALYYAWMVWIPLCLAALRFHERGQASVVSPAVRRAVLVAAALVGLPLQLALGFLNHSARSARLVDGMVASEVPPGLVVYCDPAAYYAVRRRASKVLLTTYNAQITAEEITSVGAVVARLGPGLIWERVDPRIEELWEPKEAPVLPRARLAAFRLHWNYEDYATLRVWKRREPLSAPSSR